MATPKEVLTTTALNTPSVAAKLGENYIYNGSVKDIGEPILSDPLLRNDFLNVLYNKFIGTEVISGLAKNPLEQLKGRRLPRFGQTLERMIFNPAKAISYFDTDDNILTTVTPDVKVEYIRINRQDKYPVTIKYSLLQQAFSGDQGWSDFLQAAQNSLINGDTVDEYRLMVKIFSDSVNNGFVRPIVKAATTSDYSKQLINLAKLYKIPSTAYNGYTYKYGATDGALTTWCNPDEIAIVTTAEDQTDIQVDVLAAAYHMDEVKLAKNIIEIDKFNDNEDIVAFVIDKSFIQVRDSLTEMGSFNRVDDLSEKTYWHHWQTMTFSLFANVTAIVREGFTPTPTPTPTPEEPDDKG